MIRFRFPLFAAVLAGTVAAGPLFAQTVYTADKGHNSVRACWSHFGVSRQCAFFPDADGELVYDSGNPENSKLTVTFTIDKIESLVPAFNGHLKSEQWFDSKKFPTATFVSTKIEKTSDKTGKITGNLTVKGMTKPVTLDTTLNFSGNHPFPKNGLSLGFAATGALKRSDFGLGAYAPAVSDEISLEIQTEFNKKS